MKNFSILSLIFIVWCSVSLANAAAPKEKDSGKEKEKAKTEKTKKDKTEAEAAVEDNRPKIYLKLDPSLVMNVEEKDVTRFLQVDAQLQFVDPLAQPIIEKHMPAIRHTIIMTISGAEVPKIKTAQGKEDLRKATLQALQKIMTEITGEAVIEEVYFTGFIIQ